MKVLGIVQFLLGVLHPIHSTLWWRRNSVSVGLGEPKRLSWSVGLVELRQEGESRGPRESGGLGGERKPGVA